MFKGKKHVVAYDLILVAKFSHLQISAYDSCRYRLEDLFV